MPADDKKITVLKAAQTVFSRYGFRRTSMNDIAAAAGMSRPTLYLMFANKEDVFRQLATFTQSQAIMEAQAMLQSEGAISERVVQAIIAYERVYYEPVFASPHGAEFMDINDSVATQDMLAGRARLVGHIAEAILAAETAGEVDMSKRGLTPEAFIDLLLISINGHKKAATSIDDFRQRVSDLATIFMLSVAVTPTS